MKVDVEVIDVANAYDISRRVAALHGVEIFDIDTDIIDITGSKLSETLRFIWNNGDTNAIEIWKFALIPSTVPAAYEGDVGCVVIEQKRPTSDQLLSYIV